MVEQCWDIPCKVILLVAQPDVLKMHAHNRILLMCQCEVVSNDHEQGLFTCICVTVQSCTVVPLHTDPQTWYRVLGTPMIHVFALFYCYVYYITNTRVLILS